MSSNDDKRRRLSAQAASLIGTTAGHPSHRAGEGDSPSSEEGDDADSFMDGRTTPAESESDQTPPEYEDGTSTPNGGNGIYFEPVTVTASGVSFTNQHAGGSFFCINGTVGGRTGTHWLGGGPTIRPPATEYTGACNLTSAHHQADTVAATTDCESTSVDTPRVLTPEDGSEDNEGNDPSPQARRSPPSFHPRGHAYGGHVQSGATVYVGNTGEGADSDVYSRHTYDTTYDPGATVRDASELPPGATFFERAIRERGAARMTKQAASSQSSKKDVPEDSTTG